jgi:SAM-dependent methyltransferase
VTRADHEAALLAGQMFDAALRCGELMISSLGLTVGLYEALRAGPGDSAAVAARAGVHERYAREWLEQQAAAGLVRAGDGRRPVYHLPEAHAAVLLDPDSDHYAAGMALAPVAAMAGSLDALAEAFRTGGGIDPARLSGFHGGGLSDGMYRGRVAGWLTGNPARIADLGCGTGASTVALADARPDATVVGRDIDPAAIEAARRRLAGRPDLAGRVTFEVADMTGDAGGPYELICVFDALHDLPRPVEALTRCRAALTRGGVVLLLEPRAAERRAAPADPVERFLYMCSVLHCLPVGMYSQPSAATGALLRPAVLRGYAARAGFSALHVLSGGSRMHRLYRLEL